MAGLGAVFAQDPNAKTRLSKSLTGYQMLGDKTDYGAVKQGIATGQQMIAEPIKAAYNNAKAGLSDPKVLAQYIRKGINVDALTKASDWRMAGIDAMTGSSDLPKDVQRAGVEAGMNIAMNAPAMTVWHGSPHKFDKFDMSKIGTGTNAQAYGHGLYFAESPDTANLYKVMKTDAPDQAFKLKYQIGSAQARGDSEAVARLQKSLEDLNASQGALYKSDIPDEAVARFLDWDKPLSQQAPEVQAALNGLPRIQEAANAYQNSMGKGLSPEGLERMRQMLGDPMQKISGSAAYKALTEGESSNAAAQLKELGIPGIRYLDGGSRGTGAGTSNFVLFDDQLPRILEVNGQATGLQPWAKGEWGNAAVNSQKGSIIDDLVMRRDMTQADYDALSFEQKQLLAQRRAALPTEQGGLGLPVDNTYQQRAAGLDFDMDVYHGSPDISKTTAFDPSKVVDNVQYGGKFYSSIDPNYASQYTTNTLLGDSPGVMPLKMRSGKRFEMDKPISADDAANIMESLGQTERSAKIRESGKPYRNGSELFYWGLDSSMPNAPKGNAILRSGFDSIHGDPKMEIVGEAGKPHSVVSDPSRLRSRFAAFDPFRRNDADLLGNINPTLLGAMGVGATGAAYGATQLPDEYKSAIANAFR
jgi:hypothetical protein